MDFSEIAKRNSAGATYRLELLDPTVTDGEPLLTGKKPAVVLYRASSDRESQKALRRIKRDRIIERHEDRLPKEIMESLTKDELSAMRTIWDIHDDLSDVAKSVIVGFENVPNEDGGELTGSVADVEWFLSLTPFEVEPEKDEDGNPVLNESGEPKFVTNNPFSKQIAEAATRREKGLGNGKAA